MDAAAEDDFREFVRARSASLFVTAYLLTGDRALAEDLLQVALLRTYRLWSEIRSSEHPEAYARRVLATQRVPWWRRRRLPEVSGPLLDRAGPADHSTVAERAELWRALRRLPPRTRAVLVLRYWEDLPEREVAEIIRCSVGRVRSLAARGLRRLRAVLGPDRAATEPDARVRLALRATIAYRAADLDPPAGDVHEQVRRRHRRSRRR